jgi:peptidoglycan/LPS O-acetylase OafA/YrhL
MIKDSALTYRPDIDGLRAVAVLSVIFFHSGFKTFSGGFVGVDIFFVISGYLITSILLKEMENGNFSLIRFYERRARRILPALFFVILCILPFAWMLMFPGDLKKFGRSLTAVAAFSSNLYFWRVLDYFEPAAEEHPLLHTWSLGVEEQYYLLFPLSLMLLWRLGRAKLILVIILATVISLGLSEYGWRYHPQGNFYMLPTRAWELFLGSLLAFWHTKAPADREVNQSKQSAIIADVMTVVGLALIAYSILFFNRQTPFPSVYAIIPTIGTALILGFPSKGAWSRWVLTCKPIVAIGLISYSAYLWHQAVFALYRLNFLGSEGVKLTIPLIFLLSFISYKYIELPFRSAAKFDRKRIFSFSLLSIAVLAGSGVFLHISNGVPQRIPDEYNNILSDRERNNRLPCHSRPGAFIAPRHACEMGNRNASKTVALVGDSHADALAFSVDKVAMKKDIRVLNFTYNSCPPFPSINFYQTSASDLCNIYLKELKDFMERDNKIKAVVISARITPLFNGLTRFDNLEGGIEEGPIIHMPSVKNLDNKEISSPEKVVDQLAAAIKKDILWYLSTGRIVYLVYPVPEVGWDVPRNFVRRKLSDSKIDPEYLSTSYTLFKQRNKRVIEIYDSIQHKNLVKIRPSEFFCDTKTDRCLSHDTIRPFYYDNNHLSNYAAEHLATEIFGETMVVKVGN